MLKGVALLVALVATGCAHTNEQARSEAAFYTKLGISNLVSQNCTEALRYLLEAEKRNGDDAELQNSLGLAYYCKEEHFLAIEAYKKAVALKPDFSEAWNNLGAAFATVGQYDNALTAFDKALENLLYATPERAWLNKGDALAARFDSQNAAAAYDKAISLAMPKPQSRDVVCVAYNRQGALHMRDKRYHLAVRSLGNAVKLCPKYAEPYAQLSNAYLRLGKRKEAVQACDKVQSLAPDSADAQACSRVVNYLNIKGR